MTTIWQQLGGFVYTGENLTDAHLDAFSQAGGRWLVPVLYGDDAAGPWNLANLESLKQRAGARAIRVGGWFNGWGGDPAVDAANIARIVHEHALPLVVLDLEAAYTGDLQGRLIVALRKLCPTVSIGVSGPGYMTYDRDWSLLYPNKVRYLPQWYSGYYLPDGHFAPQWCMQHLAAGYPRSYVHGTREATGVEGSDLARELADVQAAKTLGFTLGISVYTLERLSAGDFALLASQRGRLFAR